MQQIDVIRLYKTKKCLVIDDYPDIRASIKRMLTKFGANHVDTASNCEEAIEMCRRHNYDIILCDYNLGEKKSGQQLLEEMRFKKLIRHASLYLMVTAETTRDKVYSAIENQPDAYIAKPFTAPYLQQRLDALLVAKNAMALINDAADSGDYARAIKLCQEKIEQNDKYRTLCVKMMGYLYLLDGKFAEAAEVYKSVLSERTLAWALIGLGKALKGMGEVEQSEDVFRSLIQQKTPCMDVYDNLADLLYDRGRTMEAQGILEEATEMSPDAILRQQRLAVMCETNADLERAEKAYRKVVRLGPHSIHESADNYFDFVSCLNRMAEHTGHFDKKLYEDANTALKRVSKRYSRDPAVQARAKYMQSETAQVAQKSEQAKEYLSDAEKFLEKYVAEDGYPPEVILQRARALNANGKKEQAREVLEKLAEEYQDNEEITRAIDNCLDEPVSKQGRSRMVEFNREGKQLFDAKDYRSAVEYFNKALQIFPNHIALNLNLAMALIRVMDAEGADPMYIGRCRRVLESLRDMDPQHPYFKLYENIAKQVEKYSDGGADSEA